MKQIINILFLSTFLAFLHSCGEQAKKNVSLPVPYVNEFESELPKLATYKLFLNRDTQIVTERESVIKFTKDQFLNEKGAAINDVVFQIREYKTITDMIWGKLSTISDSNLIATDGMFYLNALDSKGNNLKLNPNKPLQVEIQKNDPDTGYYVFYNDKTDKSTFNWKKKGKVYVPQVWDTTSNESFISKLKNVLNVVELGFVNCDKFIKNDNSVDIFAQIESDVDVPVTCVLILKNYKTMVMGYFENEGFLFKNMPNEQDAILVCVGKNADGRFYFYIHDVRTNKDLKLNGKLIEKSKKEIDIELEKLNHLHKENS